MLVEGPGDRAHLYSTFLRLYVALTPQHAEDAWQESQQFAQLSDDQKKPGHWYGYEGSDSLIELKPDGSGQWHPDGRLPDGIDPARVIVIPRGKPVPTLLDHMVSILNDVPPDAPNRAQAVETIVVLKDLPSQERAKRLVENFQKTLASAPAIAEEQLRFLRQASQQMAGTELLAGKVRGYDVAGVLIVASIAEAVAAADPQTCSAMLAKTASIEVRELAELASRMIQDAWWRGLKDPLTKALDSMRSMGEKIIRIAQDGVYPEGHPELVLDVYYGSLLQALPYLLAAEDSYRKLTHAYNKSSDDAETFAHKADTAEEKLVRVRTALLYALQDVNLSQLRGRQAEIKALLKVDRAKAEAKVFEAINLQFFYPLNFKSILLGEETAGDLA